MAAGDQAVAEGLAKVAHAIRRSAAMTVAMNMTPSDGTVDDMLELFERLTLHIGGEAVQQEAHQAPQDGPEPIGVPFSARDTI